MARRCSDSNPVVNGMKMCSACLKSKPAHPDNFQPRPHTQPPWCSACRACKALANTTWRAANPETSRAIAKAWRVANPARVADRAKAWRAANRLHAKCRQARESASARRGAGACQFDVPDLLALLRAYLKDMRIDENNCASVLPAIHLCHKVALNNGGTNTLENVFWGWKPLNVAAADRDLPTVRRMVLDYLYHVESALARQQLADQQTAAGAA